MNDEQKAIMQQAWDLLGQGNLREAEQTAHRAISHKHEVTTPPLPDIAILKAFLLCRLGQYRKAHDLFRDILEACPDDAYAQEGLLLALRDLLNKESPETGQPPAQQRLLLGLGTGRSGSTSLTKLLRHQPGTFCAHEFPPRLSWSENHSRFGFHRRRFETLLAHFSTVADVSHWWLPYADLILETFDEVRFIALKRDREATIRSFLRIKGGGGQGSINHWTDHDGSFWQKNPWDECYPSLAAETVEAGIGLYWDQYYADVDALAQRAPDSVRVFATEDLSNPDTQRDLLTFCGFTEPQTIDDLRLNVGNVADGLELR